MLRTLFRVLPVTTATLFSGFALAQDDCATAVAVFNGPNGPFDNALMTPSVGAPALTCAATSFDKDMWFAYTATCTGTITFSTCTMAAGDTVMAVYDGSGGCGSLVQLGCNDDSCSLRSSLSIACTLGTTYFVRLDTFGTTSTLATFVLTVTPCPPPPPDECAVAAPIFAGPNGPFSNVGATASVAPTPTCEPATRFDKDLWLVYTATCTGAVAFETCASTTDTVMIVYDGNSGCASLSEMGCSDDACGLGSRVIANLVAGGTYYVRLDTWSTTATSTDLRCAVLPCVPPQPNDECTGAIAIAFGVNGPYSNAAGGGFAEATTSYPGATCDVIGKDLWYVYVPSVTAPHTIKTCSLSTIDTMIEVYDGTAGCASLVSVACNDDSCATQSRAVATLTAGVPYYVRVGTWNGTGSAATGTFSIEVKCGTDAGTITLTTPSTCAYPGTFTVTGDPNIGGTVTAAMGGSTGLPFISFGFVPAVLIPGCPCLILSTMTNWNFTTSLNLFIPCVPVFIGTPLEVQGAELFPTTPPSCAIPVPNHFTDVYTILVG